jgi:pyridoxal phosphate enzyme (YggS family)
MLSPEQIKANAAAVEERIAAACVRAGRRRAEVTLVAVTKTFPAEVVSAGIAAGLHDIGENRVQEARDKRPLVQGAATWHLIGHLQSNKAKDAVKLFDVIQTIDSVELAQKVAKAAEGAGKVQDVLVEVNVGDEPQKAGVLPADVENVVQEIAAIRSLRVRGLMSIPPIGPVEETRNHFRSLRALRDHLGLEQLSMGMSEDFEAAIEEGSTMVRVGRAIFGPRG